MLTILIDLGEGGDEVCVWVLGLVEDGWRGKQVEVASVITCKLWPAMTMLEAGDGSEGHHPSQDSARTSPMFSSLTRGSTRAPLSPAPGPIPLCRSLFEF